ncbi:hypothetical protein KCP76_14270 [Salmonella enterica subsp. enterica serovar Weltevreden]|nr:hypothetical protein KCP76_14270 [Salmonella enterica subsp. enterica serovar Weltevreden]
MQQPVDRYRSTVWRRWTQEQKRSRKWLTTIHYRRRKSRLFAGYPRIPACKQAD